MENRFIVENRHMKLLAWTQDWLNQFKTIISIGASQSTIMLADDWFREGKSRMVQRQQQNMGEPSEREHYSLYCWIYLQGSA
jgi:hypothetical protein